MRPLVYKPVYPCLISHMVFLIPYVVLIPHASGRRLTGVGDVVLYLIPHTLRLAVVGTSKLFHSSSSSSSSSSQQAVSRQPAGSQQAASRHHQLLFTFRGEAIHTVWFNYPTNRLHMYVAPCVQPPYLSVVRLT